MRSASSGFQSKYQRFHSRQINMTDVDMSRSRWRCQTFLTGNFRRSQWRRKIFLSLYHAMSKVDPRRCNRDRRCSWIWFQTLKISDVVKVAFSYILWWWTLSKFPDYFETGCSTTDFIFKKCSAPWYASKSLV